MLELKRHPHNPILCPLRENPWESQAVFNPAAIVKNGKVHLLYRAIGEYEQCISRLGYATSRDGFTFRRESPNPVFLPERMYEKWSIEDPRLIALEDKIYLTYVVLTQQARTYGQRASSALASTNNFRVFRRHGIISPKLKDVDDRNTVLFLERINGEYVMLHRPQMFVRGEYREYGSDGQRPSNIWIAYSKNVRRWNPGKILFTPQQQWEAKKINMGPPPIKTERGWLLLYTGVDNGGVYRTGAALVALQNPEKILGRLPYPILEPKEPYEKTGDVPNVVFATGAVVLGETLVVYYGAADKACAAATISLDKLISALLASSCRTTNEKV